MFIHIKHFENFNINTLNLLHFETYIGEKISIKYIRISTFQYVIEPDRIRKIFSNDNKGKKSGTNILRAILIHWSIKLTITFSSYPHKLSLTL